MNAPELVETLRRRGIDLSLVGGRLEVRPAAALTDRDRAAIRAHLANLIAALTPAGEPWNTETALRLVNDADDLVERCGVSGRHPAVADAAAMVVSALLTRDMETVRFAVAEFAVVVGRVARESDRNRPLPGAPASHERTRVAAPENRRKRMTLNGIGSIGGTEDVAVPK